MVQYSTVKHVQLEQCFFVISFLSFVRKQSLVVKVLQVKYCKNYCTKTKPVNHSKLFFLQILYLIHTVELNLEDVHLYCN